MPEAFTKHYNLTCWLNGWPHLLQLAWARPREAEILEYLDFEKPIQELEEQLQKCAVIGDESDVDVTTTCQQIEDKLLSTKKEIYGNLTPWQRVQLSK